MDQGDGTLAVRVREVGVELPQLAHQEHALVDDSPAGEGGDVGVDVGLLEGPAHHIELPVKVQPSGAVRRALHKALADPGHTVQGFLSQNFGMDRHVPPAQEVHALLVNDNLQHLLRLGPFELVLGEEEHAHAVVPLLPQGEALLLRPAAEQPVGNLEQDAHAVAGLSGGVLAGPVLQLFYDFQGVVHSAIGSAPLDVHHRADAAGVVLKLGTIQW